MKKNNKKPKTIDLTTGKRGGIRSIEYSFNYPRNGTNNSNSKNEAVKIKEFLEQRNIPFTTIVV